MSQTNQISKRKFNNSMKRATEVIKNASPSLIPYVKYKVGQLLEYLDSQIHDFDKGEIFEEELNEFRENSVYDKKSGEERVWDFQRRARKVLETEGLNAYSRLIGDEVKRQPQYKDELRDAAAYDFLVHLFEKPISGKAVNSKWKTFSEYTGLKVNINKYLKVINQALGPGFDEFVDEVGSRYNQGIEDSYIFIGNK